MDAPPTCRHIVVFGDKASSDFQYARTVRSIRTVLAHRFGFANQPRIHLCLDTTSSSLPYDELATPNSYVWFLRSGSWIHHHKPINYRAHLPAQSSTGKPLCALGATRFSYPQELDTTGADKWKQMLTQTGGNLEPLKGERVPLPLLSSILLDSRSLEILRDELDAHAELSQALQSMALSADLRTIRWQDLDVSYDVRIRIAQLITSLQRGGAERIAIDLHRQFERETHSSILIGLGKPTRDAFESPAQTIDMSTINGLNYEARLSRAVEYILDFGTDIVHAHLLRKHDLEVISKAEVPTIVTVHNMSPGWPIGLSDLSPNEASLLVACSRKVESELLQHHPRIPTRTVWNGIEVSRTHPQGSEGDLRQQHSDKATFTLVSIANPRPQKRLEILPRIVSELQSRFHASDVDCSVELLLAGEASANNPDAVESYNLLLESINQSGVAPQIHLLGAVKDVSSLLARASVLVSTSRHEGLSLAHLEALSANVPVVATDVGGTSEIARCTTAMHLLPMEATVDQFADKLFEVYTASIVDSSSAIEHNFSNDRMRLGYARMFDQVLKRQSRKHVGGLLLVINNFSTGGAQSSARRLLTKLHRLGIPVRAVVLDESPDNPTQGRQALRSAGIEVMSLSRAGTIDPLAALTPLLDSIHSMAPSCIVFWNAIAEYKLLLADCIWDIPIFDVSPGEMYFSSMNRYFNRPRPGLPYLTPEHYGQRLRCAVVKYANERETAASYLRTRVEVIPNGVPIQQAVNLNNDRAEFLIGTVARISSQKKLEELIEAVRIASNRMPPFRVQIVGGVERGSEAYAEEMRAMSAGLPIDWVGEHDDPNPFLQRLKLFVLISEPAGCPNAGLEAMAHGLPMIATDVGGASEQVVDGENGFLVPRGDVSGIAEAMVRIANDHEMRIAMGASSHQRASQRFSIDRMVNDYRRVFEI